MMSKQTDSYMAVFHGFLLTMLFMICNARPIVEYAQAQDLTTVCSECKNPLVEFGTCKIAGDLPNFEAWGFNVSDLKETKGEVNTTTDMLHRGLGVYIWFKKANPCADFYYIFDDGITNKRIGADGEAKYRIDSYVQVEKCTEGEKTLVWDEVARRTELDEPTFDSRGHPVYYDVEELSSELKLVPTIAKVHVTHQLKALKNGKIYDEDYRIYDWIDQPPGTDTMGEQKVEILHDYGLPEDGDHLIVDGEIFTAAEGWFLTGFSTSTLAATSMEFEKGEIGETIRRMETPSNCQVSVDVDSNNLPNYRLDIHDIKNKFNETLPDNVRIGLRLREGKIEGGEFIDGWHVFNTTDGKIADDVLFLPAQCAVADQDTLEICGICEFHVGPPYAGSLQFTKEIYNPLCHDAVITISCSKKITKDLDKAPGEKGDDRYIQNHYSDMIDGQITLTLKKHSVQDLSMYGFRWENYMSTSMNIDKFSAGWEEHKVEGRDGEFGYETVRDNAGEMTSYRWAIPDVPSMVTVVYEPKTNKAQSIIFRGNYIISYSLDIMEKWETVENLSKGQRTRGDEKNKVKTEMFTFRPVEEKKKGSGLIDWVIPDLQVSWGDRELSFGGRGSTDENVKCSSPNVYDACQESNSFEWRFTVNPNQR